MNLDQSLKQLKLLYLINKVGGEVFVKTLTTLYSGEKPIEENLLKFAEVKSHGFNFDEKTSLLNLKEGKRKINHMDISLSFKLIQLTCGLEPRQCFLNNSCVWSERCPEGKRNSLEHLLYRFKKMRNNLVHQFSGLEHISDKEFTKRKEEILEHLSAIVWKVGEKVQLSNDEIKYWINITESDGQTFCEQVIINPSFSMKTPMIAPPQNKVGMSMSRARIRGRGQRKNFTGDDQQMFQITSDSSLTLKEALLKAFAGDDVDQCLTKSLDKSNQLYWVDRLITTQALYNSEQNSVFWKDYENYLD